MTTSSAPPLTRVLVKSRSATWTSIFARTGTVSISNGRRPSIALPARPNERVFRSISARPLDPLRGDPYVWAVVEGDVLTVNTLIILEGTGYEIQTYERRVTPEGMTLVFSRIRNGEKLKRIKAKLQRVDN